MWDHSIRRAVMHVANGIHFHREASVSRGLRRAELIRRIFAFAISSVCLLWPAQFLSAEAATPDACQNWVWSDQLLFSPDYASDATVFWVTSSLETGNLRVLKSTDRGRTWAQTLVAEPRVYSFRPLGISRRYADDQTLFFKDRTIIKRSNDGGRSWHTVGHLPDDYSSTWSWEVIDAAEAFISADYQLPYSGLTERGVWRSTDGGATWTRIYGEHSVTALAASPAYASDRTLLIAPGEYKWVGGIYKSTDSGVSWVHLSSFGAGPSTSPLRRIALSPSYEQDKTIFVAGNHGLAISYNDGADWLYRQTPDPDEFDDIVPSPHYPSDGIVVARNLVVFGAQRGLPISRDRGDHWSYTALGSGNQRFHGPINAFVIAPTGIGISWASYVSFDQGQTWRCLGEDAVPPPPTPPPPAEVPEPATWLLLAGGLGVLARGAWRRVCPGG